MLFKSFRYAKYFCTDILQRSQAQQFYMKSLRKANLRANQKGKFSQQALLKMIQLSTGSDAKILFQAYYNYLGHFTLISSKTVDKLIEKQYLLSQEKPQMKDIICKQVLNIFQNHDYLRYFPHYNSTQKCIRLLSQNQQYYNNLLMILRIKPFIKLNNKIAKLIIQLSNDPKDINGSFSVLAYRCNNNILDMSNTEILNLICQKMNEQQIITQTNSKQYFRFLQKFKQQQGVNKEKLAIAQIIHKDTFQHSLQNIKMVPERQNYWKILKKFQTKDQINYLQKAQQYLKTQNAQN